MEEDLRDSHMKMVLLPYRRKELWAHGGFHQDFKRKFGKPDIVWQGQKVIKVDSKDKDAIGDSR